MIFYQPLKVLGFHQDHTLVQLSIPGQIKESPMSASIRGISKFLKSFGSKIETMSDSKIKINYITKVLLI